MDILNRFCDNICHYWPLSAILAIVDHIGHCGRIRQNKKSGLFINFLINNFNIYVNNYDIHI